MLREGFQMSRNHSRSQKAFGLVWEWRWGQGSNGGHLRPTEGGWAQGWRRLRGRWRSLLWKWRCQTHILDACSFETGLRKFRVSAEHRYQPGCNTGSFCLYKRDALGWKRCQSSSREYPQCPALGAPWKTAIPGTGQNNVQGWQRQARAEQNELGKAPLIESRIMLALKKPGVQWIEAYQRYKNPWVQGILQILFHGYITKWLRKSTH